jgi:hypothetical protein
MIASAIQYGSQIVLRDRDGQPVGNITVGSNAELLGHSRNFIVVQYGGLVMTLDENQRTLGTVQLSDEVRIGGINENGFYARFGSQLINYDPYCNQTGITTI